MLCMKFQNTQAICICFWCSCSCHLQLCPLTHSLHIRQKLKNFRATAMRRLRILHTHTYKIGKHHARCRVMCICINLRCNLSFSHFIRVFVTCFIFEKKDTLLCPRSHTAEPRTGYNMMQCTQIPIIRPLY